MVTLPKEHAYAASHSRFKIQQHHITSETVRSSVSSLALYATSARPNATPPCPLPTKRHDSLRLYSNEQISMVLSHTSVLTRSLVLLVSGVAPPTHTRQHRKKRQLDKCGPNEPTGSNQTTACVLHSIILIGPKFSEQNSFRVCLWSLCMQTAGKSASAQPYALNGL